MTNRLTRIVAVVAGALTFVGSAGVAHSVWSDTAEVTLSVTVPAAPSAPTGSAPTNLRCESIAGVKDRVRLLWTTPSAGNPASYAVDGTSPVVTAAGSATQVEVGVPQAGSGAKEYGVRAIYSGSQSFISNTVVLQLTGTGLACKP